jgi:hypothetical protein
MRPAGRGARRTYLFSSCNTSIDRLRTGLLLQLLIDRLATGAEGRDAQKKGDRGDDILRVATFTVYALLIHTALVAAISTVLPIVGDFGAGSRAALPTWCARVRIARLEAHAFAASLWRRAALTAGVFAKGVGPTPRTTTLMTHNIAALLALRAISKSAVSDPHGIASCRCDVSNGGRRVLGAQRGDSRRADAQTVIYFRFVERNRRCKSGYVHASTSRAARSARSSAVTVQ